jgi:hypothetical protein
MEKLKSTITLTVVNEQLYVYTVIFEDERWLSTQFCYNVEYTLRTTYAQIFWPSCGVGESFYIVQRYDPLKPYILEALQELIDSPNADKSYIIEGETFAIISTKAVIDFNDVTKPLDQQIFNTEENRAMFVTMFQGIATFVQCIDFDSSTNVFVFKFKDRKRCMSKLKRFK